MISLSYVSQKQRSNLLEVALLVSALRGGGGEGTARSAACARARYAVLPCRKERGLDAEQVLRSSSSQDVLITSVVHAHQEVLRCPAARRLLIKTDRQVPYNLDPSWITVNLMDEQLQ